MLNDYIFFLSFYDHIICHKHGFISKALTGCRTSLRYVRQRDHDDRRPRFDRCSFGIRRSLDAERQSSGAAEGWSFHREAESHGRGEDFRFLQQVPGQHLQQKQMSELLQGARAASAEWAGNGARESWPFNRPNRPRPSRKREPKTVPSAEPVLWTRTLAGSRGGSRFFLRFCYFFRTYVEEFNPEVDRSSSSLLLAYAFYFEKFLEQIKTD